MSMATPIPGLHISDVEDAYNFYLSQIRITIERAFGILVHRWAILRRSMSMSILKVPALVTCLMRLHNFCVDHSDSRRSPGLLDSDERNVRRVASRQLWRRCGHRGTKSTNGGTKSTTKKKPAAVFIDDRGTPAALLGSGHHFDDEPGGRGRRPTRRPDPRTPMRKMIQQVADMDLRRPPI